MFASKSHWQSVYKVKPEEDLSWHQDEPTLSLGLVTELVGPNSRIIDVGGGSSILAGRLFESGYKDVTVLDISEAALERAKSRLGSVAGNIHWISQDVLQAADLGVYDLWHDRAVFHFFTDLNDRARYVKIAAQSVRPGGHLVISTFAPDGPEKCSGLVVRRYDGAAIMSAFAPAFMLERESRMAHITPWGSEQSFTVAVLIRR